MILVNINMHRVHFWRGVRNRCIAGGLVGALLLAGGSCFAQNAAPSAPSPVPSPSPSASDAITPDGLTSHYPSGSIQSGDMANHALVEVEQQRAALERKYADQQHVCYSKFLATSCLDAAKEFRRLALAQIRKVEVEANSFIRSARVVERDQHLAEKRANDASNRPKPLPDPAVKRADHPDADHREGGEQRIAQHEAKLQQAQQAEKDNAQKRAEDVVAFEKKAKDAAARQRDVAAKKAEKARQAAAKAAAASATLPAAKP